MPRKTGLIRENERKTARVTLNDCLACSGCVTSAETVLIESQGTAMFRTSLLQARDLQSNTDIVVSLSPQSVASLAVRFQLSVPTTHRVLSTYFKSLGVHTVCSTQGGNDVALLETAAEFVQRYRNRAPAQWVRPPNSVADSSVASHCPTTGTTYALPRLGSTGIEQVGGDGGGGDGGRGGGSSGSGSGSSSSSSSSTSRCSVRLSSTTTLLNTTLPLYDSTTLPLYHSTTPLLYSSTTTTTTTTRLLPVLVLSARVLSSRVVVVVVGTVSCASRVARDTQSILSH